MTCPELMVWYRLQRMIKASILEDLLVCDEYVLLQICPAEPIGGQRCRGGHIQAAAAGADSSSLEGLIRG
jgi:hypothetical protein